MDVTDLRVVYRYIPEKQNLLSKSTKKLEAEEEEEVLTQSTTNSFSFGAFPSKSLTGSNQSDDPHGHMFNLTSREKLMVLQRPT